MALTAYTPTAHANVYATNIKINGDLTNSVSVLQGSSVNIGYILNEAATEGVTVKILSGQNVVRTISVASGSGTTKGTNTVVWDGKNGSGASVSLGTYSVSITAKATGYTNWTQISDDAAPTGYIPPGATDLFVLAEENMCSLNDGFLQVFSGAEPVYPDVPGSYHRWGGGFGFADGHASLRIWKRPALQIPVARGFRTSFVPATDGINDIDLQWLWFHAAAPVPPP